MKWFADLVVWLFGRPAPVEADLARLDGESTPTLQSWLLLAQVDCEGKVEPRGYLCHFTADHLRAAIDKRPSLPILSAPKEPCGHGCGCVKGGGYAQG